MEVSMSVEVDYAVVTVAEGMLVRAGSGGARGGWLAKKENEREDGLTCSKAKRSVDTRSKGTKMRGP